MISNHDLYKPGERSLQLPNLDGLPMERPGDAEATDDEHVVAGESTMEIS